MQEARDLRRPSLSRTVHTLPTWMKSADSMEKRKLRSSLLASALQKISQI